MANSPKENATERHERVKRQIAGAYAKGIAIEYAKQLAQSLNQIPELPPLLPEDLQNGLLKQRENLQLLAEREKRNMQLWQELAEKFPKSEWLEQAKGLFEVMQMQAKSLEKAKQIADATLFQVFPEASQAAEALKRFEEETNQTSIGLEKALEALKQRAEEEEKRKAAEEAAKKAERSRATKAGQRRRERELAKAPDDLWGFTPRSRALSCFNHAKFELTAGGEAVAEIEGVFYGKLKLPKGRGQNSPVLDVFARKLFAWLGMKVLAQLNALGKGGLTDTAIANIRRSKAVTVTPEAIAPDFGLTDQRRRNIGPKLKEALEILRSAYCEFPNERRKNKDGTDRFLQVNVADQLSGEKKGGRDVFRFEFSQAFAELLATCKVAPFNKKLFQIDAHKNPHSFYIADKLLDHYNQNIGKPNANRIRVCNLLKACPDLPKYEEIMSTTRQLKKQIRTPFERDFDALLLQEYDRGKYGILKSLRFCKDKGESLIAEGADDNPGIEDETEEYMTDWGKYTNLIVEFDWANIPDQTKWIEERKARTKAAKATKTQKAEKTKGRRGRPSKAKAANSPDQPVGKEA